MKKLAYLLFPITFSLLPLLMPVMAFAQHTFKPGQLWPDNRGVHINAHGGGLLYDKGTYYWYGEHKADTTSSAYVGVTCYSSRNLTDWKYEGVALKVDNEEGSDIEAGCVLERPKVIYNKKTGKYVMWFHLELKGQGYKAARTGVAVSDSPTGSFQYLRSGRVNPHCFAEDIDRQVMDTLQEKNYPTWWTPTWHKAVEQGLLFKRDLDGGQMARDMTLYVDDDGKAYHIYSSEENLTLQIAELSEDYTYHTGRYIRVAPGDQNEAPAIFKRDGSYWMITSGCTGWAPNEARMYTATNIFGPWKRLPSPCVGPDAKITFGGQSTYIQKVEGKKDTYIFMADIWRPKHPSDARYVWLPITFKADGTPVVEWRDEWSLEGLNVEKNVGKGGFFTNRFVQSTYIGVPLVLSGLIVRGERKHFRTLRNDFVDKEYKHEFESYTQYVPAAAMLIMKVCGVKSRSSWGKMLTAAAAAALIETGVTNGLKYTVKEERPDGSTNNSFPSGHTATAFMTATLLSKEYGHISPWISIGGYTVATGTGIMRMVNNRHWMSDVLAGAGIGIMSGEFGYWIADAIFPKSQKSYDPATVALTDPDNNPSFVGLYAGFVTPLKNHKLSKTITSHTGATMGLEGAYFWNKNWGAGGQVGVSDIYYIENGNKVDPVATTHFWTTQVGGYFSCHLYQRLFFGAKAIAGPVFYPNQKTEYTTDGRKTGFSATTGISLGLRAKDHLDFHIGCDYGAIQSYNKAEENFYHTIILTGGARIRF